MEVQTKTLLHTSLLQSVLTPLMGSHSIYLPGFYEKYSTFSACWRLKDCLFFSLGPEPVSVSSGTEQVQGLWHLSFPKSHYTLLPWQTSLAWAKRPTSLLIVPGFIFTVCTGTGVLMNFTFYYSKTVPRTHKPSICYTSPRTFKDVGTVVQSTYSSWPSERLILT